MNIVLSTILVIVGIFILLVVLGGIAALFIPDDEYDEFGFRKDDKK